MNAPGIRPTISGHAATARVATSQLPSTEEVSLRAQARLITLLGSSEPLAALLDALVRYVETWLPDVLCSILLADSAGRALHTGAAPSLADDYVQAIDPVPIAVGAGSCGTAAAQRDMVVTPDIEDSPLWHAYAGIARAHGLRACWSVPILGSDGGVLGAFAMYYRTVRAPGREDCELLDFAASLASQVIERHTDLARLRESEDRYRCVGETCPDAILVHANGTLRYVNRAAATLLGIASPGTIDGTPLAHYLDPASAASVLAQHDGVQTARLRRSDGQTFLAELTAADSIEQSHATTVLVCRDLTERSALEQAVLGRSDEERERLACELHDGLCQELTGISLLLGSLAARSTSVASAELAEIGHLVNKALLDAHSLASGMSAIAVQRCGLEGALQMLASDATQAARAPIRLRVNLAGMDPLDPGVANHLFRIAQEAVSNARRHARADGIAIALLWEPPALQLTIADDGAGVSPDTAERAGDGLRAMRYCANRIGATLTLERRRARGTLVRVVLPHTACGTATAGRSASG